MNIIFGIIGFIGICLVVSKKSVIFGLIISCICTGVLTFYYSDSYIQFVNDHVIVPKKLDTVFVHDTIFQEPLIFRESVGDCLFEDEPVPETDCDSGVDENEDEVETDSVGTDSVDVETDTLVIYPNPGITREELDQFVETIEEVIDSLESIETREENI